VSSIFRQASLAPTPKKRLARRVLLFRTGATPANTPVRL
jgi:hypothetical protein